MRLPLTDDDDFASRINEKAKNIGEVFLDLLKPRLIMKNVNVMLGDGTITKAETFDPEEIRNEFKRIIRMLDGWVINDISDSKTEDLYRLYFQISKNIEKFYIYGYFGIQFHALSYYKVDKQIINIQKELITLNQNAYTIIQSLANKGDLVIEDELKKYGYNTLPFEELFVKMFEDIGLMTNLEQKAVRLEERFPELQEAASRRDLLISELDKMVMELYRISPIIIDYNKLMQGQEGVISYFEIETIKNKKNRTRDPYINTKIVSKDLANNVYYELEEIYSVINRLSNGKK